MNLLERSVDTIDPRLSVRLRLLKSRLKRDVMLEVIKRHVVRGQTVVDIGAHRGVYTWMLSDVVGPAGRVNAFEPNPANVRRLHALARSRSNIVVHPVGLSRNAGEAHLRVPRSHHHQLDALGTLRPSVDVECDAFEVPTRTLDGLDEFLGGPIGFLKCDVEGHEDAVFAGAEATVSRDKPVIVVEIEQRHRDVPVLDLVARLVDLGYDGYFLQRGEMRPAAEFDVEEHQLMFLTDDFVPYSMPEDYVSDFLFTPRD